MRAMTKKKPAVPADIEDLHRTVVQRGEEHYEDPATGYLVFTELVHRKRGYCCGNACRHCPFDWENVGKKKNRNFVGGDKEDDEADGARNSNGSAVEKENDKNSFLKASRSVDARMDDPSAEDVTDRERLGKADHGLIPSFIRKLSPRASVLCVGAASLAIMLGTFRFYRTRS